MCACRLYEHDPEFNIFYNMVPNYWREMARAKFCLAPAGWGWGSRVKAAIVHGCVPLIIQVRLEAADAVTVCP